MNTFEFLNRYPELRLDVDAVEQARIACVAAELEYFRLREENALMISPFPLGALMRCDPAELRPESAGERFLISEIFFAVVPKYGNIPTVIIRGKGFGDYSNVLMSRYIPIAIADKHECLTHMALPKDDRRRREDVVLAGEYLMAKRHRTDALARLGAAREKLCSHRTIQELLKANSPYVPGSVLRQPGGLPIIGRRLEVSEVRAVLANPGNRPFKPADLTWEVSGRVLGLFNLVHEELRRRIGPNSALVPSI